MCFGVCVCLLHLGGILIYIANKRISELKKNRASNLNTKGGGKGHTPSSPPPGLLSQVKLR